jgi:hypothetical protein
MTTPARYREAEQAGVAYQLALTQIGVATVADALRLWANVPVQLRASVAATWLQAAIQTVMARRGMARALARAYYRLVRALITGTTVADPYRPEPPYITLDELRRQFAALAGEQPEPSQAEGDDAPPPEAPDEIAIEDEADVDEDLESDDDEADRILVEELEGLREAEERAEREAEAEIEEALRQLGLSNLANKVDAIDTSQPADQVDAARAEAHTQAGARQAAAAARVAMNGGRKETWTAGERDSRMLGYIRLSRTGTPCGWCAMLISRGAVYKSARSAGDYAQGNQYHDNCRCFAEPVFSREQYRSSDRYALNREFEELWPQVTRGLSGKAALSAWRRFIREQQKAAAQAGRP